ncbi:hypothetical protein, partial [Bifidobacterium adolescentis]|uniref:hypothetical protein n=1 Tax=Bifidobacterium adolescentis TaxID=1680 RepID=UPI001F1C25C4
LLEEFVLVSSWSSVTSRSMVLPPRTTVSFVDGPPFYCFVYVVDVDAFFGLFVVCLEVPLPGFAFVAALDDFVDERMHFVGAE